MKRILFALPLLVLAAGSPALACTVEEVQAKAMEAATKMQTLAATDPQKVSELAQKLSATQTQATIDLEGACKTYDEILAELE